MHPSINLNVLSINEFESPVLLSANAALTLCLGGGGGGGGGWEVSFQYLLGPQSLSS